LNRAKNHCFTSVKIEPRPKITILPPLKIEPRSYTKLGIQNANALFFIFYNVTFVFSLLWTCRQPSTVVIVHPPFTSSATVEPPSTLLRSFGFHSSRWFVPRSYHASLRCAIIPPFRDSPFFYFTFCIIVFAILVVILRFVRVLLGFSWFLFFFSYFWLFLVFLWLCSLSGIVVLWWDCVAFGNVSIVASSHYHSLHFSRSQVVIFVIWVYEFVVYCVLVLLYVYKINYLLKLISYFADIQEYCTNYRKDHKV